MIWQQLPLFLFLVLVPSLENSAGLLKDLGISCKVLQRICNKINKNTNDIFQSRLQVVPHFSSRIVERAKRERAWKSPHARKGDTPRSTIPEEKWGTTRSLISKYTLLSLLFASKLLCKNTRGKFARLRSLRFKRKIGIIIKGTNFRQNLLIWEKHPNLRLHFEIWEKSTTFAKISVSGRQRGLLRIGPNTALIHLVHTTISLQLKLTQCFQQADQGSKGQSGETQNQIVLKLKRHLEIVSKLIIASSKWRIREHSSSTTLGEVGEGGGVLRVMAYTGRLRPKGVSFSGFRYISG